MHLCYNNTSAAATIFQATHMMAKPKQKSVRELVEAFLKTQHEENRYVSQPSLTLQENEIKGYTVTNYLPPPPFCRCTHVSA